MELDRVSRYCGPEPDMEYRVPAEARAMHVSRLATGLTEPAALPPLIVVYDNGALSILDGNHRYAAQPTGFWDRAIMRLRLIGLWPGQLVGLDVSDVNHETQSVRIRRRNHREEYIFLDDSVWKEFRRWLAVRDLLKPETPAVFLSLHWTCGRSEPGLRISPRAIALITRRYEQT